MIPLFKRLLAKDKLTAAQETRLREAERNIGTKNGKSTSADDE